MRNTIGILFRSIPWVKFSTEKEWIREKSRILRFNDIVQPFRESRKNEQKIVFKLLISNLKFDFSQKKLVYAMAVALKKIYFMYI